MWQKLKKSGLEIFGTILTITDILRINPTHVGSVTVQLSLKGLL